MRASFTIALALAAVGRPAVAQFTFGQGTKLDSIATRFKIDFAIPEAPAFSLLQLSGSSILRPGTVREFAALASNFVSSTGGVSVPKEVGFEFAPFMLLQGPRLTLNAYQDAPALYRLRLSAAVTRKASALNQLAVGVRVAIIDKADLRTNAKYLSDATELTTAITDVFLEQNAEKPPAPGTELTLDDLTAERRAKVEALGERLKKRIEDRAWNEDILDLAVGVLAGSPDSSSNNVKLTQYAGWLTYGIGLGRWGQLLAGFRGSAVRDTLSNKFKGAGSLSTRLYGGVNQYKAFLEIEGKAKQGDHDFLLNAGGEARLMNGGWVQFSSGLSWVGHEKPKLVGNLTFKLGVLGL